jgi:hypothetical protein
LINCIDLRFIGLDRSGQKFPPNSGERISVNYAALDPPILCDANGSFAVCVFTAATPAGIAGPGKKIILPIIRRGAL